MSRPSVLHVLARPGGGGGQYVRSITERLTRFEHSVYLLTERRTPIKRPPLGVLARLPSLRREVRRHQLLHLHGAPTLLMSLPVLDRRPTVITTHGLNVLHSARPQAALAAAGMRRAMERGATVIAVSAADRDELLTVASSYADSVRVVHNGVVITEAPPGTRAAVRHQCGIGESTVAVLFVGELAEHKQPIQLVEAIRCARDRGADVAGFLVGDGPLRHSLESEAGGVASLLGEREDIVTLLAAADVFIMPSLHEGLSLSLLQAMAAGTPVIASAVPSNREAIADAGIVVPPGDGAALCESLVRLAVDPEQRSRLGARAARRASELFDVDRMVSETGRVYDRALTADGRGGGPDAA